MAPFHAHISCSVEYRKLHGKRQEGQPLLTGLQPPKKHVCLLDSAAALCCRTWFARMSESAEGLLQGILPPDLAPAAAELAPYWADSFGNATRIDYGTGHETTFAALLCCLAKLGVFLQADLQASPCPGVLLLSAAGKRCFLVMRSSGQRHPYQKRVCPPGGSWASASSL